MLDQKRENNFSRTKEILAFLFRSEFCKVYELNYFDLEYDKNGYGITLEVDALKNVDPDIDYLFNSLKDANNEIRNFFKSYPVSSSGQINTRLEIGELNPIVYKIDFIFGEKLDFTIYFYKEFCW